MYFVFCFVCSETNQLNVGLVVELWTKGLIWDTLLGTALVPLRGIKQSSEVRPTPPPPLYWSSSIYRYHSSFYSYIQTVPNHRRLLIINDKSLPHKRRSFTRLLIFKIKFSSEPPTRWLTRSAEMTPVIGNAQWVHANFRARWFKSHPHELINDCGPPAACELRVNH